MSADLAAALTQWVIIHNQAGVFIRSLEHSPHINKLIWLTCVKTLSTLDFILRKTLK